MMRGAGASRRVVEEGTLAKWFGLEMARVQEGFVPRARPLADLLLEDHPSAPTRSGEFHVFDKAVLQRFHDAMGAFDRRRLRLPLTFYVDKDMPDDAYLTEEIAVRLLKALGEIPAGKEPREGRLWLAHTNARLLAQRHRGAFQFAYL